MLRMNLSQKGLLLVLLPLAFEIFFVSTLCYLLTRVETQATRAEHSRNITAEGSNIERTIVGAANSLVSFQLTKNPIFLERSKRELAKVRTEMELLRDLLSTEPQGPESFEKLNVVVSKAMIAIEDVIEHLSASDSLASTFKLDYLAQFREDGSEIAAVLNGIMKAQKDLHLLNMESESKMYTIVEQFLVLGILVNVVIALGLAIYFNRSTINRLRTLMDNTMRITAKKELNVPVGGYDEIKQLDTFIRDMAHALQESARFKQEVISMVSHDLRSPLTSIQITVQSLMSGVKGDLPADALDAIEGVEKNTSRLIKLINNLLDSEKLEAGELEPRKQEISLQLVVSNAVEALDSYTRAKSIDVDDSECDIDIVADGDRLEQVVTNYLSNAIKFSPANSKIVLRGSIQDNELLFEVVDQGPGVPPESREEVFEQFKQLSNQNGGERIKGSGLGLSICKRMIEAHGGTVGVKPNPDGGSIFWFKIPYSASPTVAALSGQNDHVSQ